MNKMSSFKHILSMPIFLSLLFCVTACKPSPQVPDPVYVSGAEAPEKTVFRRKPENRRIVLALGASWSNRPVILKHLLSEYGDLSSGGILQILNYPEDFLVEGRVRLSVLTAVASDALVDTLITLGTPQGTARELLRLHASRPELHIITLFPEDDALEVEAASDFVLEQAAPSELLADETASAISDSDVSFLLLVAAFAGEQNILELSPLTFIEKAIEKAHKLKYKKNGTQEWKMLPRIDPDTGLKARNHMLLEISPQKTVQEVKNEHSSSN